MCTHHNSPSRYNLAFVLQDFCVVCAWCPGMCSGVLGTPSTLFAPKNLELPNALSEDGGHPILRKFSPFQPYQYPEPQNPGPQNPSEAARPGSLASKVNSPKT